MSIAFILQEDFPLSELTTIGLGGPARLFADCQTADQLPGLLAYADSKRIPWIVLGGGSNVVFSDAGFDGLVIRLVMKGVDLRPAGEFTEIVAEAGEDWDPLVLCAVENGLAGFECLSGIPGSVGATPIQNVGAYGQEVSETITRVEAFDTATMEQRSFSGEECLFSYRQSRFKGEDKGRYIITRVHFRLRTGGAPTIRYEELRRQLSGVTDPDLQTVRDTVISLRRRKSMVIDPRDPNSRSVGSFFMNPVIPDAQYRSLAEQWKEDGNKGEIPSFPEGDRVKIPAGWLVEHSGFSRGLRRGGVGISANHALALVNLGGKTSELLSFADEIRRAVRTRFSISLEPEPTIVP